MLVFVACVPTEDVDDKAVDSALEEFSEEELTELANIPEDSGTLVGEAKATLRSNLQAKINSDPTLTNVKSAVLRSKAQFMLKEIGRSPIVIAEERDYVEEAVREFYNMRDDEEITDEFAKSVDFIWVRQRPLISVEGKIEKYSNLDFLKLGRDELEDLTGLQNLTKITKLHLDKNQISDISELAQLKTLEYLILDENNVTDISALVGLNKLVTLSLKDNLIVSIPGSGWDMPVLNDLDLRGNLLSEETCALLESTEFAQQFGENTNLLSDC